MWTISCNQLIWDGLGTTRDFTMMRCSLALLLMLWSCESRSVAGEWRGSNRFCDIGPFGLQAEIVRRELGKLTAFAFPPQRVARTTVFMTYSNLPR